MLLKQKSYDLTEGPVRKMLVLFVLPIIAGSLFQQLYTTADAAIVGRFAGKQALAAIDAVYNLIRLPTVFFTGLASAATILISQHYGAKKSEALAETAHTAVLFSFFAGLLLTLLGVLLAPACIRLLNVPEDIYPMTLRYTQIYFSGMAASMVYNIGAGIFRAVGDSKTPFVFLLIANGANVALDFLFVAIFRWGVAGVALTTVFSQLLSAALMLSALTRTKLPCKISLNRLRIRGQSLAPILKKGLPIAVQSTLYPLANMLVQSRINPFGTDSIAAWAVCGKLDFLVWLIADAFCDAAATFVAQNYGARRYDRGRRGVKTALLLSIGVIGLLSVGLYLWNVPLAHIFVQDAGVIAISARIMAVLAPLYILYVPGGVLPGAVRGTGDTFRPMLMTLAGCCVTRVIWVLLIAPLRPTLMMVLLCYPVSWAITSLMFILYRVFYEKAPHVPAPVSCEGPLPKNDPQNLC